MITRWKQALWGILAVPFIALGAWLFWLYRSVDAPVDPMRLAPLRIAIMDPLCQSLADDSLRSHARRDYTALGTFLEKRLNRPVELVYDEGLRTILGPHGRMVDLIIGPASVVRLHAADANEVVRPIIRLTDAGGETECHGLFIVRQADRARSIGDLDDHRILFGPRRCDERYSAALATLAEYGVAPVPPLQSTPRGRAALLALAEGQTDAAVIPSYAVPLLKDHDTGEEGAFRVVGRTASVPFITVFAAGTVSPATERSILEALMSVRMNPQLLQALDSKAGFVNPDAKPAPEPDLPVPPAPATEWTDWRGPGRKGISPDVPARLPAGVRFLWRRGLTGTGLAGVAATATHVIVADKSGANDQDLWRCLDAETGRELWMIAYATPTDMEFTNVPRATPVIHGTFAYLLGAFGDLHCVAIPTSQIMWRRHIVKDFGARLPPWGMCSTPLVVDDVLVVNPGAGDASLVALGLHTGEVVWKTPGEPAAYASMILGTFGGVRQIVGYDAVSLGGWDPNTGRRLWKLLPDKEGDYNVPTPLDANGRLLVATENNGTRLYGFGADGTIEPMPLAQNLDLVPDTSTPVVANGLVFGCFRGLYCLDLDDGLRTLYSSRDDKAFRDYVGLMAGNDHVLAVTVGGELALLEAARDGFTPVSRLRVCEDAEVWSYPALVGDRLYLRSTKEVCCLLLDGS